MYELVTGDTVSLDDLVHTARTYGILWGGMSASLLLEEVNRCIEAERENGC